MFKNVIVKTPCKAVTEGITSAPELGKPDYEKALKQHESYIAALKQCGVEVTVLPADENFPDSCFVEDTAVLTKKCAVISNPGAATRTKETEAMIPVIKQFYPEECIEYIQSPGTMEGGDVMMVGDTFYIGRSARTNEEGIRQFSEILAKYGYTVVEVLVPAGYPTVEKLVKEMGYEVILVDTSEFRKIDGGLSCLSLRFTAMK